MPTPDPRIFLPDGTLQVWRASTLRALGKDEKFLEKLIAKNPDLLGLDPYRSGVRGPYTAFTQKSVETPHGRTVQPDIIFLTQSGHVIVVEVKLCDNAELKDRRVVGQIVEYAASLASYDEDRLVELFSPSGDAEESWDEFVAKTFPGADHPDELADELLRKFSTASIHLVIACDTAPTGLRDFVRAVTNQSALGAYELQVVELVPHVTQEDPNAGILVLPNIPVRTEIVARTAVTVSYAEGQPQPGVKVEVTPQEEMEAAIQATHSGTVHQMRPEFAEVVRAWNELAEPPLRTIGNRPAFRQIQPLGWPKCVHYEFLDRAGGTEIGVELHLENKSVKFLQFALSGMVDSLKQALPGIAWDPKWSRSYGRLAVIFPQDVEPTKAVTAMKSLIEGSLTVVTQAIEKNAVGQQS